MFNSISDWIKLPQQVQMPTVNMPKIPDIFGMATKKEGGEAASDAHSSSQEQPHLAQQQEATSATTSKDIQAESAAVSGGEAASAGESADSDKKKKMPIDIDTSKAIDQAKEIGNQAKEIGTNIGNMLFNFGKNASNNMIKTATHLKDVIEKTSIIGDFSNENEKFVSEKKSQQRREEAAVPPWVGYNEEDKMKEQIMELSLDSRNFLRSPPDGVDFNFDYNTYYPIAMATLDEDANLKAMRFKLVPAKINEENFWRNYFYRVSLIKQSTQLSEFSESNTNFANDKSVESELNRVIYTGPVGGQSGNNEFVSDSYAQDAISVDEIKSDLKQLKLDSKKAAEDLEDTDWDKELPEDLDSISPEELEKEINQMIGKE